MLNSQPTDIRPIGQAGPRSGDDQHSGSAGSSNHSSGLRAGGVHSAALPPTSSQAQQAQAQAALFGVTTMQQAPHGQVAGSPLDSTTANTAMYLRAGQGPLCSSAPGVVTISTSAQVGEPGTAVPSERSLCTFYMRTGTCAYGDRCKFAHPLDRPPPILNTRGYPIRQSEPDCVHYLKKGWCAFGQTCRFSHPEIGPVTTPYTLATPRHAGDAVALPRALYATGNMYNVQLPASVPALFYMPSMTQQLTSAPINGFSGLGISNLGSAGASIFPGSGLATASQMGLLPGSSGLGGGIGSGVYANTPLHAQLQHQQQQRAQVQHQQQQAQQQVVQQRQHQQHLQQQQAQLHMQHMQVGSGMRGPGLPNGGVRPNTLDDDIVRVMQSLRLNQGSQQQQHDASDRLMGGRGHM